MYKESKAESKKQQRFFGMVHSVQRGELSPSKVGPAVRKAAKNTDYSDAKDFASTKHKNLPEKKGSLQMKYFEKQAAKSTPGVNMHGVTGPYKVVNGRAVGLTAKEIKATKNTYQATAGAAKESKSAKILSKLKAMPKRHAVAAVGAAGLAGGYLLGKD